MTLGYLYGTQRFRYTVVEDRTGQEQEVLMLGNLDDILTLGTRLMWGFDEEMAPVLTLRRYAKGGYQFYRLESSLPMVDWLGGAEFKDNPEQLSWGHPYPEIGA